MTQSEAELVTWKDSDLTTGRITWFLAGMRGTVQFVIMEFTLGGGVPMARPADLGYHSPVPMYENQRAMSMPGDCTAFRSPHRAATCYYDGSGLAANRIYEKTGQDSQAIYLELRDYYFDVFYGEDNAYEAGHIGTPFLTEEEHDAAMLENCKILYKLSPSAEMAALIRGYEERLT